MEKNKKLTLEIGQRLKEFAENKYGSIPLLAKVIEMNQSQLQNYVYRKEKQPLPGTEVLLKLHKVGCDITWLLTGEESKLTQKSITLSNDSYTKILNKFKITKPQQLEDILTMFLDLKNKLRKTI